MNPFPTRAFALLVPLLLALVPTRAPTQSAGTPSTVNQPDVNQPDVSQPDANQPGANQPAVSQAAQTQAAQTTVGMRVRIDELPLPGTKLRAVEVQDPQQATLILRVLNVFRHGSGFRYNLEVTPLVAGRFDLRQHLEREDGSSKADLPPIPVLATAELAADRLKPNELRAEQPPGVGGYGTTLVVAGIVWVIGLVLILFARRRRQLEIDAGDGTRPVTLADRLRPLVEGARAGELDDGRRAELERLLLAYWRRRRNLEGVKIDKAIRTLRRDEEASPLLLRLEEWLHRPQPPGETNGEDIAALLEPYRNAPDLEAPGTASKESA